MNALGNLPGIIAAAMGHTLFRAATLHKKSGGAKRACRALVVDFTDWQRANAEETIPASDRNAIILADTLADTPKAGDTLVIDGGAWIIHTVNSDPAHATYECRSTRCPIPAGDTTEADSATLLDDLPGIMNDAMGAALFSPAILYKITGRISDGRGGFVSTFSEYECSAIVTEYSDLARGADDIPAKDRKVLILSASLPGYVTPKPNDIIVIADQPWGLIRVDQDPARATFEAQATPARLPTVGRIGQAAITLRDASLSASAAIRLMGAANITLRDATGAGGGSGLVQGALTVTLSDATAAGTVDFTNRGVLAITLSNATLAGAGTPVEQGQAAGQLVDASLSASGSPRIVGVLAATLQNAHIEASGPIDGVLAKSLANASLAAAGAVRQLGALSYQLTDATLQATGVARINGVASITLADATGVGVASSLISGALSLTINDATLAGAGTSTLQGAVSKALLDAIVSSAGYQRNIGAVAVIMDDVTAAGAGTSTVTGQLAITLENSHLDAGGANVGQLGITLAGSSLAATGYQANWGALAQTLADATLAATGSPFNQGALAQTLGDATVIAEGYQRNAGALSVTLADATLAASSDLAVTGSLTITLENAIAVSNGSIQNPGQLSRALDDSALIAEGYQRNAGALSVTLSDATLVATGTTVIQGASAATLNSATVIAEGYQRNAGALASTLTAATIAATGVLSVTGALGVTLDASTLVATANLAPIGSLAATLLDATLSAIATPTNNASLSQTLSASTLLATGVLRINGAVSVTLDASIVEAFGANGEADPDPPVIESASWSENLDTVTVPKPTGVVSGDLLLLVIQNFANNGFSGVPSGWTEFGSSYAGDDGTLHLYYKWAGGSEPSDYSWTRSGAGMIASMYRISGADPTTPIQLKAGSTGTAVARTHGGVTTTNNNSLVIWWTNAQLTVAGTPSGFTTSGDETNAQATDDGDAYIEGYQRVFETAGATGSFSVNSAGNATFMTMAIVINPDAPDLPAIEGELAVTLADASGLGAGVFGNVGALAKTLDASTLVATGTTADPPPVIQGTLTTKITNATFNDTISKPTGATAGELLVLMVANYLDIGEVTTITTPAGWRLAPFGMISSFISGAGTVNLYTFYRWCDGTEGSTFPITASGPSEPDVYLNSICMRVSGVDATTPWGADYSENHGTSSSRGMASIDTDEANSLLIVYTPSLGGELTSDFTDMTYVADVDVDGYVYRQDIASAGTVSAKTASMGSSNIWMVFGVSLRPGAGFGVNPANAPTFVASGALSTATSVTSRTPAAPAGVTTDDIEIVTCASENNATHSYSGSGWTKGDQMNSGSGWTVSWGWRRRTESNVDPVISWTGTADGSARRHAFRGCITSGTPVVTIGSAGNGTGSTHTSTGGNTTAENSLAIYLDHAMANTAIAQPSGWTEDTDSGSATGPVRTALGHKTMAASGVATGNISVTGASAAWVNFQLELKAN